MGVLGLRLSLTSTSGYVKIRPIGCFRYCSEDGRKHAILPSGSYRSASRMDFFRKHSERITWAFIPRNPGLRCPGLRAL
jgi:hypothetical protein